MGKKPQNIEIEIDKLTNSIENSISGDSFQTEVLLIEIDLFFDPKPLIKEEQEIISNYIKADKIRSKVKHSDNILRE